MKPLSCLSAVGMHMKTRVVSRIQLRSKGQVGLLPRAKEFTNEVLILCIITVAFEAQFGPTDTKTLDELQRLAIALKHLGSFAEAKQLLKRVLAAKEAQDGPNSRPAVLILNRLA
jgi:hypothetical protein